MPKLVNHGGQRRTSVMYCGKTIRGHPTEVNKISTIHFRVCKVCNPDGDKYEAIEFNKTVATENGWGGLNGNRTIGVNTTKSFVMTNHRGDDTVFKSEAHNTHTVIIPVDAPLSDDMLIALFDKDNQTHILPNKKKN